MPGLRHAHTLQQLRINNILLFFSEILLFLGLLLFDRVIFVFFDYLSFVLLNTLPGVSTHKTS